MITESVEQRMTQRATRLAALQILYGQQFHGETIQQIDPLLREEGQEDDEDDDLEDEIEYELAAEESSAAITAGDNAEKNVAKAVIKSAAKSAAKSAVKSAAKSDRAFLARLLSSARTNKHPLQTWLATCSTNRSWQNIDLLLRLILWLATAEMLLERVGGRGSVVSKAIEFATIGFGKRLNNEINNETNSEQQGSKLASKQREESIDKQTDKRTDEKIDKQTDKRTDKKLRRKLGILAGEYCGIASLFYDERGTIGFVNGILDKAADCDLSLIVEQWFISAQQEKLRLVDLADERAAAAEFDNKTL